MLIKCKECGLQVSDQALYCPHCGIPILGPHERKKKNKRRRKRLPNGFGQITELKNQNLRKRFRAMVTVGKDSNGKPICKLLKPVSYFKTYNEAYEALVEYNKDPYDIDTGIRVREAYEKWLTRYKSDGVQQASIRTVEAAWRYCWRLYDTQIKQVRPGHMKDCINDATAIINGKEKTASSETKYRMKSLFNLIFDYAVEYGYVDHNYARDFSLSKNIIVDKESRTRTHFSFTDDEMKTLWNSVEKVRWVDLVLIQCYSGWRPQELGNILLKDVDLDRNIIVGGMKTDNGKDRIVPIHPKIKPFIEKYYNEGQKLKSAYLFNCTDSMTHGHSKKMTYDKYSYRFAKIIENLKLKSEHKPHDCRVQFVTMAKKYNVDEYAIKYIVGHAIQDLTERVYTDREVEWLIEEINKIEWTPRDSNPKPAGYEPDAPTNCARGPKCMNVLYE